MTRVVTELVIDDNGALSTLDRFADKMDSAGASADRVTSATERFHAAQAKINAAIERGTAVTTQSIARKSREQAAWDSVSASIDKQYALRMKLSREADRAGIAASNAVLLGIESQEVALQKLTMLEARHTAQMNEASTAAQRTGASHAAAAAQIDAASKSMNRLSAANDNARGSTANIAAQFQDIGVTAAMGMSPIMIALQQGTQLSAVLGTMQNPIRGLGAALMSVLNPVSLLTIAFVALAAVAIQWFMGAESEATKASTALEKHSEWLDKLLKGYDGVRDAAQQAADAAARLPEGVVASDLQTSLKAQEAALESMGDRADELKAKFAAAVGILKGEDAFRVNNGGEAVFADITKQIEALRDLKLSASSTAEEIDAAAVAARKLFNSTDDSGVRDFSDEFFQFTEQLRNLKAIIASTVVSLSTLKMQDLSNMQTWGAIANDTSLGLSMVERAAVAAAWAISNSGGAAVVAASQYGTATGAANEIGRAHV